MKTGDPKVDALFKELDRRIESPTSQHSPDSKERLRKLRVQLHILAADNPARMAMIVDQVLREFGFSIE